MMMMMTNGACVFSCGLENLWSWEWTIGLVCCCLPLINTCNFGVTFRCICRRGLRRQLQPGDCCHLGVFVSWEWEKGLLCSLSWAVERTLLVTGVNCCLGSGSSFAMTAWGLSTLRWIRGLRFCVSVNAQLFLANITSTKVCFSNCYQSCIVPKSSKSSRIFFIVLLNCFLLLPNYFCPSHWFQFLRLVWVCRCLPPVTSCHHFMRLDMSQHGTASGLFTRYSICTGGA